ncbi:MAG: TolC family protein, partial [Pedosphaera sp.]|nr:TolC family protein [Pedosphaera sp.]
MGIRSRCFLVQTAIWLLVCAASPATIRAESLDTAATTPGQLAPRKLTLAEAKRVAFEKNWDLLAAKSGVDFATAQRIVAGEFPNPTVSLSVLKINTDAQPTGTRLGNDFWHRNYDTIAAVNQLIEIGGKRSSRKASAVAGITGAKARMADARRLLDAGVTKAYISVLVDETDVEILRQSAASLRREAQIAEARLKAGDISAADKSRIDVDADRLELDAKTAESTAAAARIAVEILMGLENPRGIWVPGDSLGDLAVSSA